MLEPWIISPQASLDRPNNRILFYRFDQKAVEDFISDWRYIIEHPKGEDNILMAAKFASEADFNNAAIALKMHYGPLNNQVV